MKLYEKSKVCFTLAKDHFSKNKPQVSILRTFGPLIAYSDLKILIEHYANSRHNLDFKL